MEKLGLGEGRCGQLLGVAVWYHVMWESVNVKWTTQTAPELITPGHLRCSLAVIRWLVRRTLSLNCFNIFTCAYYIWITLIFQLLVCVFVEIRVELINIRKKLCSVGGL